jgi:hypothetical protein
MQMLLDMSGPKFEPERGRTVPIKLLSEFQLELKVNLSVTVIKLVK